MRAQVAQRAPAESADADHDHHRHQRSHRDLPHQVAAVHHQHQQQHAGHQAGQAAAATRRHVDDRLADHRAAGHAAEEPGDRVGHALADAFAVALAGRLGDVLDDLQGHHRFEQADHGQRGRHRQQDAQRFPAERYIGDEELRQAVRQLAHVTNTAHVHAKADHYGGEHDDCNQRRRHSAGEARQQVDDRQCGGTQHVDGGTAADQFRHLRQEDQDRQRVDEAGDDRARDESHQRPKLEHTGQHLQQAGQDAGGEQVLQAMVLDQVDHHQRHCTGGGGDHARPAASDGGDHRDGKRGVQADLGVDAGDEREGDGLGNQGQGDDHAGQQITTDVAEPLLAQGVGRLHGKTPRARGRGRMALQWKDAGS
ncbi:hypothetical protein GPNADHDJ_03644 [Stenotrophomonas maltophilia]|uniref:Uncharacterized protein n=1 Tax=Stenotrophomonas maltophilia TaxID=40324 RepID=A0AAX1IJM5_STEMA|nr:hypothetical protein GPNADHDJ_03644 [Stenotrophomonas maltophilia]